MHRFRIQPNWVQTYQREGLTPWLLSGSKAERCCVLGTMPAVPGLQECALDGSCREVEPELV